MASEWHLNVWRFGLINWIDPRGTLPIYPLICSPIFHVPTPTRLLTNYPAGHYVITYEIYADERCYFDGILEVVPPPGSHFPYGRHVLPDQLP